MSERSADGKYRVFCAYPHWCGAETFADSEAEAERLADSHESHNPTHHADYEQVTEPVTDDQEVDRR